MFRLASFAIAALTLAFVAGQADAGVGFGFGLGFQRARVVVPFVPQVQVFAQPIVQAVPYQAIQVQQQFAQPIVQQQVYQAQAFAQPAVYQSGAFLQPALAVPSFYGGGFSAFRQVGFNRGIVGGFGRVNQRNVVVRQRTVIRR